MDRADSVLLSFWLILFVCSLPSPIVNRQRDCARDLNDSKTVILGLLVNSLTMNESRKRSTSFNKRKILFYAFEFDQRLNIFCLRTKTVLQKNAWRQKELAILLGCPCEDTKKIRQGTTYKGKRPDSFREALAQDVHSTDW